MLIPFRTTPVKGPLTFGSVGNHWHQETVLHFRGYPLYHYLQTETGCGRAAIQGHNYILHQGTHLYAYF